MALSNSGPSFSEPNYTELIYDPFWFSNTPPNGENMECVPARDIRDTVA